MRVTSLACMLVCSSSQFLLSDKDLERRSLDRFRVGHAKHAECWDRVNGDGFLNVIDLHNHFQPFGGPEVPFDVYLTWMRKNGILFANMMGLGQQIVQSNIADPTCCYYLHCPTFNYTVEPSLTNDRKNAFNYVNNYKTSSDLSNQIYLLPSLTFPNLQSPQNNSYGLTALLSEFPNTFTWMGEINVFKHALAANGFFNFPPVTEVTVANGGLDAVLLHAQTVGMPVTLHCDIGCDNYYEIPNQVCYTPADAILEAHNNSHWWQDFLGPYFNGFFNASGYPLPNFNKVQHLKVFDAILMKYSNTTVVWSHMGLSKELLNLHPAVHAHILETFFQRYPKLYADISWDIVANIFFLNYNGSSADFLKPGVHPDVPIGANFSVQTVITRRQALQTIWKSHATSPMYINTSLGGPTFNLAILLETFETWSTRFVTGTDYVASFGNSSAYPGLQAFVNPARGCQKTPRNHAGQVSDTSSVNIFFSDGAFQKIVLGDNFFQLAGLSQFAAPKMCVISASSQISVGFLSAVLIWFQI